MGPRPPLPDRGASPAGTSDGRRDGGPGGRLATSWRWPTGGAAAPRARGRGALRRVLSRPVQHRHLHLPGRAGRGGRAAERGRRRRRRADRERRGGPAARARGGDLAVRSGGVRRARARLHEVPERGRRARRGGAHGGGPARARPRPAERPAEAARAVLPGGRLHLRDGDARRDGREQQLRHALAALRQHGPQRPRHRRGARGRHPRPPRRERRARPAAARRRAAGDPPPRGGRDRGAVPEDPSAGQRVQPRPARRGTPEPREAARRLGGHAGGLPPHRARAVAAAPPQGARRLPLPDVAQGDGVDRGDRRAPAHGGGAGRPDDDRARPEDPDVPGHHGPVRARRAGRAPVRRVRRRRPRRRGRAAEDARRAPGGPRDPRRRGGGARARVPVRRSGRSARPGSTS